ncbi:sulfur oxidation c-type cytochrome SoxX [Congregibacter brevis]|uniref:Sulfur oxidation c-type cytochrome SoxX n=1 Tax=Congregibacter brevis TaxID=3081201 RepID=A0ABZ0IDL5_9GAMM|nr:sulfur oxidation c-type cytochrome SoxX [Congregibacter sp. IMCC45268]
MKDLLMSMQKTQSKPMGFVLVSLLGISAMLHGLSGRASDEAAMTEGREIAADRNRGNCYSCHMADGAEMTGNGGPPLMQMQLRFPEREVLKAQIADPRTRNPNTVMPPYGAHGILTERELDLVVDYIHSL